MARRKKAMSTLRHLDARVHIITGLHIRDIGKKFLDAYGEDIGHWFRQKIIGEPLQPPPDPTSPYSVLHCSSDDPPDVVRARFRLLVKELHPDTGSHPDPKEYQRVVEAYNAIQKARHP